MHTANLSDKIRNIPTVVHKVQWTFKAAERALN